jgi:hypothetical protein
MPKETRYGKCDCEINKRNPFPDVITAGIVRKILLNKRRGVLESDIFLQILSPTDCRDCLSYINQHFCCNQERVKIYLEERR